MRTLLTNLTTVGFVISFILLLVSIFIDHLPFIRKFITFDAKFLMYFSIIGCVVFSYQMGRNSYAEKIRENITTVQADVKVSEEKSTSQNTQLQSDILGKTYATKEIVKVQKIEVDKTNVNQECKIDNSVINAINGAIKE